MKARVIALVVAAFVALGGVVAVVVYAQGATGRAVSSAQPATVYVTDKLVPTGTTLDSALGGGLVSRTTVPVASRPVGALATVDGTNRELVALGDIQPGEVVLAQRFGTTAAAPDAIEVPPGKVAIAAQMSDPAKVGAFVRPGSHIVVYDTSASGSGQSSKTVVLLPDVLVIAVGDALLTPTTPPMPTDPAAKAPGAATGSSVLVTVALPPADATRLVHAIQTGKLYLALRGKELTLHGSAGVTDAQIFS
ncbi:MAG: RcpC/CpaB family pilus assembly protein [Actinomycetota bacterium]|nr:RcpC/CpaB family pilus assembly protein [Actinomycetota bacterium]